MLVEAGHLGPDQEAELVGPVQPARVLDFLMLASPVEAERPGELDIAPKSGIARRSQKTTREVALVQDQALDVRLPVQPETAILGFDFAQPEIAVETIRLVAVLIKEPDLEVV